MPDREIIPRQSATEAGCLFFLCPQKSLSKRELEALMLAAQGLTDREIGQHMWITARTVNAHLERARLKLNALNRTHAVTLAFVRGLFKVDTF